MHWNGPKIGVLGDFKIYLSKPQKGTSLAQNTRFDVSLVQIGPRVSLWPDPERRKKWRPAAILDFLLFW